MTTGNGTTTFIELTAGDVTPKVGVTQTFLEVTAQSAMQSNGVSSLTLLEISAGDPTMHMRAGPSYIEVLASTTPNPVVVIPPPLVVWTQIIMS